jgi:hypothetical protein
VIDGSANLEQKAVLCCLGITLLGDYRGEDRLTTKQEQQQQQKQQQEQQEQQQ